MAVKKVKTSTGFTFNYDANRLDDMRLVKKITYLQNLKDEIPLEDAVYLINKIAGGENEFDRLLDHLEKISPDGIAHTNLLLNELGDFMRIVGENSKK